MPDIVGMFLSLLLPFGFLYVWWLGFSWWLQRVPPNHKAMEQAELMGPAPPPVRMTDSMGNVRHEWASDLMQQRLRNIDVQRQQPRE